MVPPLFLDVQSHHYVLDICVATGSKTFQLLEMIHKSAKLAFLPKGMVIENDVDVQRCNLSFIRRRGCAVLTCL
jgi:multisite-specific tRNA:(cytosine-C5)-methyltransferase